MLVLQQKYPSTIVAYDICKGKRVFGKRIRWEENSVIIVEGIHGLNDKLINIVPPSQKLRLFISPLTQLNIDETTYIASSDNRLIRRLVRDDRSRGYSAEETIKRWPAVLAGEQKYIYPFLNQADVIFNSVLEYELAALKTSAERLLYAIPPSSPCYGESRRLLRLLSNFFILENKFIPLYSLLREFIGGSPFYDQNVI